MKIFIVLCSVCLALTACATTPVPNAEAINAPKDQIISCKYLKPSPNAATIIVKKDSGTCGSACSSRIFVNGEPIADLDTSEKIVLYLPEGEYILGSWPNGICGGVGGMAETTAQVKPGKEMTFRVGYGSNGNYFINRTAF